MRSNQGISSLLQNNFAFIIFLMFIMISCIIGSIMALGDLSSLSFWLTFVNFVFIIKAVHWITHNWLSPIMQFSVSFLLYSLSGPFAVLYYPGRLPSPFCPPYQISSWLFMVNLSLIGFTTAILFYFLRHGTLGTMESIRSKIDKTIANTPFYLSATILAIIASIGEVINFARIGFFKYSLRSLYYKIFAETHLIIPAERFSIVASGALGLWWSLVPHDSSYKRRLFISWLFLLPVIGLQAGFGNRSGILNPLLAFITGYALFRPLKNLKIYYFALVIVIYCASVLMMVIRNDLLAAIVQHQPMRIDFKQVILRLNPGFTEFGITFGTFSEVLNRWSREPLLGTTYLRDLVSLIPGVFFPFERPKPFSKILIEEEMIYGSQFKQAYEKFGSSVRCSQMANIYINFREIGFIPFYFFLGLFLIYIEALARKRKQLLWVIVYPTSGIIAFVWHTADNWILFPSRIMLGIFLFYIFYLILINFVYNERRENR